MLVFAYITLQFPRGRANLIKSTFINYVYVLSERMSEDIGCAILMKEHSVLFEGDVNRCQTVCSIFIKWGVL